MYFNKTHKDLFSSLSQSLISNVKSCFDTYGHKTLHKQHVISLGVGFEETFRDVKKGQLTHTKKSPHLRDAKARADRASRWTTPKSNKIAPASGGIDPNPVPDSHGQGNRNGRKGGL